MAVSLPPAVLAVLADNGWNDDRRAETEIAAAIHDVSACVGRRGNRHEPFPACLDALNAFGGLYVMQDEPGQELRRRPFAIDPILAAATADTLADFARLIGTRLFPLGVEGEHEAVLAIDERGRVFALDHAGEWCLGETIEHAVTTLVTGRAPARVHDDGSW